MFEYAVGQYQKHPPSKRLLASWVMSCICHVVAVLVLMEYPQLLQGGMNEWFRQRVFSPPEGSRPWRNVITMGSQLQMPPPEVLKKYIYDWNRAKTEGKGPPPIRVNIRAGTNERPAAPPKPQPDKPAAPGNPPISLTGIPSPTTPPLTSAGDAARVTSTGDANKTAGGAPPDSAPKQIPKGVAEPPPTPPVPPQLPTPKSTPAQEARPQKAATDQEQGRRMQGGTFDTKGYPLEEYINIIEERVKENWLIPSNLRYSQGSTTIIFYIRKDGQSIGVRVDVSSGNNSLDIAALRAVVQSSPFPPLPKDFPADRVGARFVFAYNERQ